MFFDQKMHFYPNLITHNMYALASFGFEFRRSEISRNDRKNSLHLLQNNVLVEFHETTSVDTDATTLREKI